MLWLAMMLVWQADLRGQFTRGDVSMPCAADTLQVEFVKGESTLDLYFADNKNHLNSFTDRLLQLTEECHHCLSVIVYAGASPEGPAELNRRLGERRAQAMVDAIATRLADRGRSHLMPRITIVNEGARWQALRQAVSLSAEPWRDRVLAILQQPTLTTGANAWLLDPRELQLRQLDGGRVWKQLDATYLPPLRSAGTAVIARSPITPATAGRRDTIVVIDTVYYLPEGGGEYGRYGLNGRHGYYKRKIKYSAPIDSAGLWLLKTNLPVLATGCPNLGIERSLGRRWSLQLYGAWTWYTLSHNAFANELLYGAVELRHYLGNRHRRSTLSGWFLAIGGGAGYYDLEWRSKGYQGEAVNAYVALGYQHRFGRKRQWAFEVDLGAGALLTRYRYYYGSTLHPPGHEETYDDHLMWQRTDRLNWIGPNWLSISIGRRI